MIKGLIITHGDLGRELIQVAEKILERKADLAFLSLNWEDDGSDMDDQLDRFIVKNKNHDIIIFTDMFGGSPSNISTRFINQKIEVISGINLPGLLKFITYREKQTDLKKLVKIIEKGAIDGISILSEYLGEKK